MIKLGFNKNDAIRTLWVAGSTFLTYVLAHLTEAKAINSLSGVEQFLLAAAPVVWIAVKNFVLDDASAAKGTK